MPAFCGVIGCANSRKKCPDKYFFRLPKVDKRFGGKNEKITRERRGKWLANLARADITEAGKRHLLVCSDHFLSGRPTALEDATNPDWAPTQNLGHCKVSQELVAIGCARHQRIQERKLKKEKEMCMAAKKKEEEEEMFMAAHTLMDIQQYTQPCNDEVDVEQQQQLSLPAICHTVHTENQDTVSRTAACQTETAMVATVGCQTDLTLKEMTMFDKQYEDLNQLRTEVYELRSTVGDNENLNFSNDDEKVLFYTGLPTYAVLMCIFTYVSQDITHSFQSKLSMFQEFVMFLMHLRINTCFQDLAYRFNVCRSTVSRIFSKWVDIADMKLKHNIVWPGREELRLAMPACFRRNFGDRVSVILDCFEVTLASPSSLMAKAATWSNYKHNNTMKFLIGITPTGCISFISKGWGGRVSDKTITEKCGILENLLPGDIVLADRGFGIEESVGIYRASLYIPAFTRGKAQLSAFEVENTRKIANVRIHVERVIGLVRRKYKIFQGPLPIELVRSHDSNDTKLDKIVRICCGLVNCCPGIVPMTS